MFKSSNLKQVNLEITNRCQADCPMCPRNIHGGITNPELKISDWTFDDFVKVFPVDLVKQLEAFTFCGNFGDPILNKDLPLMCEYIKKENPEAFISIHTNGSLRKPAWWAELVPCLTHSHQVVFALDGLEDTQALYRVNTDFNKIIENATAFIKAGGNATWHFIRFKHNQHQVKAAEQLAQDLGFKTFTMKDTRRFTSPTFKVVDSSGNQTHVLEPTTENTIHFVDRKVLETTLPIWSKSKDIYCFALDGADLFIDVHFTVMPCCILSSWLYTSYDETILSKYGLYDDATSVNSMGAKIKKQVWDIVDELGGLEALDAKDVGIRNIIDSPVWQTIWHDKWATNGSLSCSLMCSKDSPFISLAAQVVDEKRIN